MKRVVHLCRRAVGSISNRGPGPHGVQRASQVLNDAELALWSAMDGRDRTHSLVVLERFDRLVPAAPADARAAALLHDVGKTDSGLGWAGRVVATIVGARGARFASYADHERIGASMIAGISSALTVDLVAGRGPGDLASALRQADDV